MIWQTECVARVSPESGEVVGWIDFSGLRGKMVRRARKKGLDVTAVDVLNGIAWHQDSGRLWITGKQWPALYEVKLIEVDNTDPQLRSIRRKCIK
jgi:glutamine cyclotransferase